MRKLIAGFIGLMVIAAAITSCSGKRNAEKERMDSIRIADSIAVIEAAQAEQARLDSIRQDSIENEDKLRVKPEWFMGGSNAEKKMKGIGFKKVRKKIEEDPDDGIEYGEVTYERILNGRKIKYEYWWDTCSGEILTFQDSTDLERFIEDLQKLGFRKQGNFYVSSKLDYYPEISIEGKKVNIAGCG